MPINASMQPKSLPPVALYIHWPFCASKCPYCDFNSYVRASIDEDDWHACLIKELDYWGRQTEGRQLHSIFFGGGTPSLMPPALTEALLQAAFRWWKAEDNLEVTLEANPTSVEARKLKDFHSAGGNRLSLGLQALNDPDLQALGRQHSAEEGIKALGHAQEIFSRVSFDLIYARERQSLKAWEEELARALSFGASHLSLYQLTIEENTRFASLYARNQIQIPDSDLASEFYDLTQRMTEAASLPAYEISNHARPGEECRHNLVYWRYQDYIGIGPGAHGRVTLCSPPPQTEQEGQSDPGTGTTTTLVSTEPCSKFATATHRTPEKWLTQVRERTHGLCSVDPLSEEDQLTECLLMGLRTTEGIPMEKLAKLGFSTQSTKLSKLRELGFLTDSPDKLQATTEGRLRLNTLLAELLDERTG